MAGCGRVGEQRIGHSVQRMRQSARELPPGCTTGRTEERCLGMAFAVRFHGARSNGDIPDFGTCRVGCDRPAIVPVESLPGLHPCFSGIAADSDACASAPTLVDPVTTVRMKGKGMAVAQCTPAVSAPGLATIEASHYRSCLDSD